MLIELHRYYLARAWSQKLIEIPMLMMCNVQANNAFISSFIATFSSHKYDFQMHFAIVLFLWIITREEKNVEKKSSNTRRFRFSILHHVSNPSKSKVHLIPSFFIVAIIFYPYSNSFLFVSHFSPLPSDVMITIIMFDARPNYTDKIHLECCILNAIFE